MISLIRRYTQWLHTQWPAGTVEKLPVVGEDGRTNVPGLHVTGDLTGIPLLKFSADSGARAIAAMVADGSLESLRAEGGPDVVDVAIVGGGVSGMAAALEAEGRGLSYVVLEASAPFSTIVNFPKGKPIYTYPTGMKPAGAIDFAATTKEELLAELREQAGRIETRQALVRRVRRQGKLLAVEVEEGEPIVARRVVVGIGRSGNRRRLGVPGEDREKVFDRLHDPLDFAGQDVLVVGGGDSALESAVALTQGGANVTLSYRGRVFSRPKPDNVERVEQLVGDPAADVRIEHPRSERTSTATGRFVREELVRRHLTSRSRLTLEMGSELVSIDENEVVLRRADGQEATLANDAVFSMIGREAPLDFFRESGVRIHGERNLRFWITLAAVVAFCIFLYHWKKPNGVWEIGRTFEERAWFPHGLELGSFDDGTDRLTFPELLAGSMKDPGFYYSLAYCSLVVAFGIRRIRRRRTPYVTRQTVVLMFFQLIPLFLLPYFVLPYLGHNGLLPAWIEEQFFPGRSYWRSFGIVLAWPLFIYNVFTDQPIAGWLVLSFVQTFVLLPLAIRKWGKGVYCGWICSCGALAETLGDAHRHKMPHGPFWNRLNMAGQVILAACFVLLAVRIVGWVAPAGSGVERMAGQVLAIGLYGQTEDGKPYEPISYAYLVDLVLAGVVGVSLYFHFSGRMWCRFFCPLAALMHIYTRFSRFRILADKKRCISCNVCTSVCHQGIDIMNFANKGLPMNDPECVRCSACVQSCPTGVLQFGEVDPRTGDVLRGESLPASPVRMRESG